MPIVVHVWESAWARYAPGVDGHGSPGHASIQLGDFTYVSWWPGKEGVGKGRALKTFQDDLDHYEKAGQRHWISTPHLRSGANGLDLQAMIDEWKAIQTDEPDYTVFHHCSWVVHELLKSGGGDKYARGLEGWYDRTMFLGQWSPRNVKVYTEAIQKGLRKA
jgi:hypothetical protein